MTNRSESAKAAWGKRKFIGPQLHMPRHDFDNLAPEAKAYFMRIGGTVRDLSPYEERIVSMILKVSTEGADAPGNV